MVTLLCRPGGDGERFLLFRFRSVGRFDWMEHERMDYGGHINANIAWLEVDNRNNNRKIVRTMTNSRVHPP